jgi:prepilin-type N-terminal cleavage/methylation domain-containing protein
VSAQYNHSHKRIRGFTLVELLVALALLGIVLSAVVYVNIGTIRSSASLQSRNELLSEMQIAQNYMASKLKQAAYIFPINDILTITATGTTTNKPPGGSAATNPGLTTWKIGVDPIVAFVLPPKVVTPGGCVNPGSVPVTPATTPPSTYTASDTCYTFYAFYAMRRSVYVAATTGASSPGEDVGNLESWVLVEYRGLYSSSATNFASTFSPTNPLTGFSNNANDIPTGNSGRILMDYLVPRTTSAGAAVAGALPLFGLSSVTTSNQSIGTTNVAMNMATSRTLAGQIVRLPSSLVTDFTTTTVYPRNVGKPPLNN